MDPDDPIPLSNGVWLWPSDPDPSRVHSAVGVVAGTRETALVDTGNCPGHATKICRWAEEMGLPPIGTVIYTHHHWDHAFGACALGAHVVAHRECLDRLREEAAKPWNPAALQAEMTREPRLEPSHRAKLRAIRDWTSFRIVLPRTTFEHGLSLDLGGLTLELSHVGGGHASDSIIVRVPEARLAFLGDCYYPGEEVLHGPGLSAPGLQDEEEPPASGWEGTRSGAPGVSQAPPSSP